jgi:hypothetical protein
MVNLMPHGMYTNNWAAEPCPHHLSCFACGSDDTLNKGICELLVVIRRMRPKWRRYAGSMLEPFSPPAVSPQEAEPPSQPTVPPLPRALRLDPGQVYAVAGEGRVLSSLSLNNGSMRMILAVRSRTAEKISVLLRCMPIWWNIAST